MLRNYITIGLRGFLRNPFFTIINIGGFAVGLAVCILIYLWIADEYSFDKFHANYDRIYKVYRNEHDGIGNVTIRESLWWPAKAAILDKSHVVKYAVSTTRGEPYLLQAGENKVNKNGLSVTEDFFKIFTFPAVRGSTDKALMSPKNITLTESTAKALFGDKDPINQTVRVNTQDELKVVAVIADVPPQSIFHFDFLLPMSYFEQANPWLKAEMNAWNNTMPRIYLLLNDQKGSGDVDLAIRNLGKDHNPSDVEENDIFIEPMSRWRLFMTFEDFRAVGGQIVYVRLFSAIALIVLAIACFNFMNLATSQNVRRAQEVGIRKCLGSRRHQLIIQFLGESISQVAISLLLALGLVEMVLPIFNMMVDKHIALNLMNPQMILYATGIVAAVGVMAGGYPALYLSSFVPSRVLKGKAGTDRGAAPLRRLLVTLQFGLSVFLLVAAVVIYQQVQYGRQRNFGFKPQYLIQLRMNDQMRQNFNEIKRSLIENGSASSVTQSTDPITRNTMNSSVAWPGNEIGATFAGVGGGYDFLQTLGSHLISGRDFSQAYNDSSSVLLSAKAANLIGKDAVGTKINSFDKTWTVVGVFNDLVIQAPLHSADPFAIYFVPQYGSTVLVRLSESLPIENSLAKLQGTLQQLNPDWPADYTFADVEFDKKFSRIELTSRLAGLFTLLAILVSCLGLTGLVSFSVQQRVREMGIRKVFGATIRNLVVLITKDYVRLVAIGFVLALPVSIWGMNEFLQQFNYRISISWWTFPTVGIGILILTLLVVGIQALKASVTSPAVSLRQE